MGRKKAPFLVASLILLGGLGSIPHQVGQDVLIYSAPGFPDASVGSGGDFVVVWSCVSGLMRRSVWADGGLGPVEGLDSGAVGVPVASAGDAVFWLAPVSGGWQVQGVDPDRGLQFAGTVVYGGNRAYLDAVALLAFQEYVVIVGSETFGKPRLEFYSFAPGGSPVRNPFTIVDGSQFNWLSTTGVAVATDGANVFGLFSVTASGLEFDVYRRIFNAYGGAVTGDFPVSVTDFDETDPAAVFDGAGYTVALAYWLGRRPTRATPHPPRPRRIPTGTGCPMRGSPSTGFSRSITMHTWTGTGTAWPTGRSTWPGPIRPGRTPTAMASATWWITALGHWTPMGTV
jgi:hypothetical protein